MILDVSIEDTRWSDLGLEAMAHAAVMAVLQAQGIDADAVEVSVLACDDARIAALNTEFRGKPVPTNVLSWPAEERGAVEAGATPVPVRPGFDGVIELGDIAIAYDTCAREAGEMGKSLPDHARHLIVHGLLHLLGYDHERDQDATVMETLETEILGNLGVDDPY